MRHAWGWGEGHGAGKACGLCCTQPAGHVGLCDGARKRPCSQRCGLGWLVQPSQTRLIQSCHLGRCTRHCCRVIWEWPWSHGCGKQTPFWQADCGSAILLKSNQSNLFQKNEDGRAPGFAASTASWQPPVSPTPASVPWPPQWSKRNSFVLRATCFLVAPPPHNGLRRRAARHTLTRKTCWWGSLPKQRLFAEVRSYPLACVPSERSLAVWWCLC